MVRPWRTDGRAAAVVRCNHFQGGTETSEGGSVDSSTVAVNSTSLVPPRLHFAVPCRILKFPYFEPGLLIETSTLAGDKEVRIWFLTTLLDLSS